MSNVTGNIFDIKLLRRVISLSKPYKRQLYFALILSLIIAALSPVRPKLIGFTIDTYIAGHKVDMLYYMTIGLLLLILLEFALRYMFTYRMEWLGQSVIRDLRINVFKHVSNLQMKYFDTTPIGTSTTRTINDVETINEIFAQGIISIASDILMIIVIIGVMFYSDWKLSLASLSTLPFFIFATYKFKENIKSSFQTVRTQVARINAFLQEHISGMKVIQIFHAEEKEFKKFTVINAEHRDAHIQSIWHYSVFFPIVEILVSLSVSIMVGLGAFLMLNGSMPLETGPIVTFILLINMLYRPLRMLADKFNTLQMGLVASERVFTLLDRQEFIQNTGTQKPAAIQGNIMFEHVFFEYKENEPVLKDLNINVKAGETLAIVGATGSGKTSTISILNRLYEIKSGKILIDGIDIKDIELEYLRSKISVVLQDVFLFRGTIWENISLGRLDVNREKAIEAAKLVGAHDFIMKLPNGYDHEVRERGSTLSAGQRQLISFVRALVANPSILILDEATASVDTESEQLIQKAIETLVKGRTSIIIAHRLSTIRHANTILVLDKGEMKEQGSHEELMQQKGIYHKLYELQFKEKEVA